jgi:GNAT superfamily N-acetyltransferase
MAAEKRSEGSAVGPEALELILDCLRAALARTADEVRPIDAGLVATTASLPAVWWLNQVRVSEGLAFEELVQLADEHQAGLGYRQIAIDHQAAGRMAEAAFRRASWKVERDLLMVLSNAPYPPADTSIVLEAGENEVMELMERWHDDDPSQTPAELDQLIASSRREVHAQDTRLLGVRGGDRLLSMTQLRAHGDIAQVEDVYTLPEARGRGYARALITRAIELGRESGRDLIFITADDEGWPKLLYERLGFSGVGHVWQLHRGGPDPPTAG